MRTHRTVYFTVGEESTEIRGTGYSSLCWVLVTDEETERVKGIWNRQNLLGEREMVVVVAEEEEEEEESW